MLPLAWMDDAVLLSRIQFAFVIAFHFLLPALTIGLASYIAVLEGMHFATRDPRYLRISRFWLRIFALSFGLGVVSGIVLPFQIGTNWSRYGDATANVVAPLMAYESLTAFFLEAAFLGVLLFGRRLVPAGIHFGAAVAVAVGTLFSAFWILSVNSWMQTPAGFALEDGRFMPVDWTAIVFNPSFPYRFAHTVTAVYLTTAFTVIGVAASYLRAGRFEADAKLMIRMGLGLAAVLVPAQLLLGDLHGLNTLAHQPQKVAAMEAIWETGPARPGLLFAIPDAAREANRAELAVPYLASLVLTHDPQGVVRGLKDFPPDERPPVLPVFYAFRAMVAMWLVMATLTLWGGWLWLRGRLAHRGFLAAATACIPVGYVAVTAGWVTTEVGRQPYVVYGLLRTAEAVTPGLSGAHVAASLALYVIVYLVVFGAGVGYLARIVRRGPADADGEPADDPDKRPARPMSAAHGAIDGGRAP